MEIINNSNENSRERFRKRELQVYIRQINATQDPPGDLNTPQQGPPPPPTRNPPASSTLLKTSDIELSIDIDSVLEKINVHVPLKEIINIPSLENKVEKSFKV